MGEWDKYWKDPRVQKKHAIQSEYLPDLIALFRKRGVGKILDLGCGSGRNIAPLTKAGFFVVGQDISDAALSMAQKSLAVEKNGNYALIKHAFVDLPFPNRSFDAIIGINSLHHNRLGEIKRTIGEMHRVLNGRGVIFASLTSREELRNGKLVETGTYLTIEGNKRGILHHLFTVPEIRQAFGGFKILNLQEPTKTDRHWLLLAEKR